MAYKIKILYVDDQANNLFAFLAHFRNKYEIYTCLSGEEGLKILNEKDIQVIVTDQRMPNMTGIEFIEEAIKKFPEPMRIVVTAHREVTPIINAFNEGKIFSYHNKPWDFEALKKSIEEASKVYFNKMMNDL